MHPFHALIFSLVEGFTEFLPVSSTGHLILTAKLLNLTQTDFLKTFEIFIQLGAILAVVFLYLPTFLKNTHLLSKLIIAFLPSSILGFFFYPLIKNFFLESPIIVLQALFVGGILLIIIEIIHREKEHHLDQLSQLSYRQSLIIGIFQSLSFVPGVSRAATTIVGGLLSGLKRSAAVEFSFLLAVPTMLAATSLDLYQSQLAFTSSQTITLTIGFIGSFITAVISIKFLLNFVKHHTFIPFGIYRIILSLLFWTFIIR